VKRQFNYTVVVRFVENDDATEKRAWRCSVRASDEDRALLAARQHCQLRMSRRGVDMALDEFTAVIKY